MKNSIKIFFNFFFNFIDRCVKINSHKTCAKVKMQWSWVKRDFLNFNLILKVLFFNFSKNPVEEERSCWIFWRRNLEKWKVNFFGDACENSSIKKWITFVVKILEKGLRIDSVASLVGKLKNISIFDYAIVKTVKCVKSSKF